MDLPGGDDIVKILKPFVKKAALSAGDIAMAVRKLTAANLLTATGLSFSHAQVGTWIRAVKQRLA